MSLTTLIQFALGASVFLDVFSLGLKANARDATCFFRNSGKLARALLSMFIVMPLFAAALASAFDLHPVVKIALVALAVAPVPPLLPKEAMKAGGRSSYAIGLLVAASLLSIVFTPLAIDMLGKVFGAHARLPLGAIARIVLLTVIVPLGAGMLVRRVAHTFAERTAPLIALAATALLVASVIPILFIAWPAVEFLLGDGTLIAIVSFVLMGLAAGHLLGGPDPENRTVQALSTASRHPGIAMAIASANFPELKLTPAAILLYLIVSAIVLLPYLAWRKRRHIQYAIFIVLLVVPLTFSANAQPDPLPSWNDGVAKRGIIDFVTRVTKEGGPDFVPVEDRIGAFDNDGTLWVEKPLPVEVYFTLTRLRELAAKDPSLKERLPFKAALEGDAAYFREAGAKAVLELILATHSGMDQEQFAAEARRFIEKWRHPKLDRPINGIVYQPMIELLVYLRRNGFQIWLCSGGTIDFMRAFAPQIYGVPVNQIIGSELKRESRMEGARLVVWRLPEIDAINDKEGKPVGIDRQIGKRPVFVAGNVLSGGDIAMMEYSKGRVGPSFQLLINHDDDAREFAYAEKDNASLNAAKKRGFTVASVKSDWKTVFGPGHAAAK